MPYRDGLLAVVSGPAGSGKTTLAERLIRLHPDGCVRRAVTATTRKPRPGEVDGKDYHFLSESEFLRMIDAGEFIEHTRFNNNYYGTPRRLLEENVSRGGVVLLVIEVEGAESIRSFFPEAVFIFILPPTPAELRGRLEGRGTETREDVENRLAIACGETRRVDEYDFLIINDNPETAAMDFSAVLRAVKRSLICGDELLQWEQGVFKDWDARRIL